MTKLDGEYRSKHGKRIRSNKSRNIKNGSVPNSVKFTRRDLQALEKYILLGGSEKTSRLLSRVL